MSNEESTLVGSISRRIDSTDTDQSYGSFYRPSRSAILFEMRNAVFLVEFCRSLPFTISKDATFNFPYCRYFLFPKICRSDFAPSPERRSPLNVAPNPARS